MTITSIREALQSLSQALQVSSIFPAAFFVTIQVYFVLPQFFDYEQTSLQAFSLAVSASLMISYLLYAFNFPLIRVLEGYKLQTWWPLPQMRAYYQTIVEQDDAALRHMRKHNGELAHRLRYNLVTPHSGAERNPRKERILSRSQYAQALIEQRRWSSFPSRAAAVLPTKLGNVIAAWEEYAFLRYGMDAVVLWPRLVPILRKRDFLRFVNGEKTVFDFLLNLLLISLILGGEFLVIAAGQRNPVFMLAVILGTVAAVYLLYEALIVAARQWGATVKVAFDLFRHDLHQQLGLKAKDTFEDDCDLWQGLSEYLACWQEQRPDAVFLASGAVQASQAKNDAGAA